MEKVFISYDLEEEEEFNTLAARLDANKMAYVRLSDEMRAGRIMRDQLRAMINDCGVCIFIATRRSVERQWCLAELGAFWGTEKTVIVYLADGSLPKEKIPAVLHPDFFEQDVEKVVAAARDELENKRIRDELERRKEAHILAIGHTCWDTIIDLSCQPRPDDRSQIGGSTYYGTHAISYMADQMACQVSIDLLATYGQDRKAEIGPRFLKPSIRTHFLPRQRTLHFLNRYLTASRMDRKQEVLTTPDAPISAREVEETYPEIVEKLGNGWYHMVLLLPLTPHDFLHVARDMMPFLRKTNPKVAIGLDLQGLTRKVSPRGGPVGEELSDSLPLLLSEGTVRCAHASIREARFVLEQLDRHPAHTPYPVNRPWPDSDPKDIERMAHALCLKGIPFVGLTDGGRGSCVAWLSPDGVQSKHIRTPTTSGPVSYATGSGDTWFGIFAYALFGLGFQPMVAGCLATQFATVKCEDEGALEPRHRDPAQGS